MEIWQLIVSVAGVIIGFLVGFFAEPVKAYFSTLREKSLLREGMYKEIAFFYERMVSLGSTHLDYDWETYKKSLRVVARFECYEFAKSNPMLFYQIDESPVINQIYANYATYVEGYIFKNVEEHWINAKAIAEITEDLLLSKKLNKALFLKSLDEKSALRLSKRLAQKESLKKS